MTLCRSSAPCHRYRMCLLVVYVWRLYFCNVAISLFYDSLLLQYLRGHIELIILFVNNNGQTLNVIVDTRGGAVRGEPPAAPRRRMQRVIRQSHAPRHSIVRLTR